MELMVQRAEWLATDCSAFLHVSTTSVLALAMLSYTCCITPSPRLSASCLVSFVLLL